MLASQGVRKPAADRALAALAAEGKLVLKEFGKTKIYFPPQGALPTLDPEVRLWRAARSRRGREAGRARRRRRQPPLRPRLLLLACSSSSPSLLSTPPPPLPQAKAAKMAEIADLAARAKAADEAAAAAKRALAAASATLTAEQLATRIAANRAEAARLDARLAAARGAGGAPPPAPAAVAAAEAAFAKLLAEWARRRRIFTSAWDAMSENLDAKAADLFEEIGVETDEAVGEALATYRALLPSAKKARA